MADETQAPDTKQGGPIESLAGTNSVPFFYANFAEVVSTFFDMRLTFGILKGRTKDGLVIERVANVMMSPQHAKSLSSLLNKRIENYEKRYGPIPTGPIQTESGEEETNPST